VRLKDKLALLSRRAEDTVAVRHEHVVLDQVVHSLQDGEAARRERIARLRSLIGEVADRARHTGQLESSPKARRGQKTLPVGELRETASGPLHVVETFLEPDHCHGRVAVRGALSVDAGLVAKLALDPKLEGLDLSRMLLLDTETTGLAGGTGTVPFLIGLAFFEDGALKVEQLFLRQLGQERPMLTYLAERLAGASCVVSYNGKAFDWPLLRTRSILNRVPLAEPPAHLDLLHCARRLLKAKLESVRLCEVERELLGHYREDDVHGSAIPQFYLDYLRGGEVDPMLSVLEHNASDLIGLAAILPRMVSHFAEVRAGDDPIEHLAFAKVALRARDYERAEAFARAAVDGGGADALARQAHQVVAASSRKRGDVASSVAALVACLARTRNAFEAATVHYALAKVYEHGLKDFRAAHRHALYTLDIEGPKAHGRRLGRLRRKLLLAVRPA
jgi:uncharacterized protein YprB with RNaseH-like and TPR domain